MSKWTVTVIFLLVATVLGTAAASTGNKSRSVHARAGRVRIDDHVLHDKDGPFLGLGASYFTALWRCKCDRARLKSDLEFLSRQGFNYYRMLSMVGRRPAWEGKEIVPVPFEYPDGRRVDAWPDYWSQLQELVDLAYDKYGLRTQITIFADAQLMPDKADRIEHLRKLLDDVVAGREHKVMLLEVANEAWQNGFPEEQGVEDLQEFAAYLADRTEVPIAISSNHDWPAPGGLAAFKTLYAQPKADVATWHFARDREADDGWLPVYDCWEYADLTGYPPIASNEPIGPGSSVNAERDPLKLVMAATFAYTAKAPMYVFHSAAGAGGNSRFDEMPGIDRFHPMLKLLPPELPNWSRYAAADNSAPFTTLAGGKPNRLWTENLSAVDGCIRHCGSRHGNRFVSVPIGIQSAGLKLAARLDLNFDAYNPLTGEKVVSSTLRQGESITLSQGPGALIILGELNADASAGGE